MNVLRMLESPALYETLQQGLGFFNARYFAVTKYLSIQPGMRVIDIGCGPGTIVRHLPAAVDYVGFDIDRTYIDYANAKYGRRGRFYHRLFDAGSAAEVGPADLVMMNGVFHHLSDDEARGTFATIASVLSPRGLLFTLDGCYRPGQNRFARYLLDKDRGTHVRDEASYRRLLSGQFARVETDLFENLSWVPYTFVFARASN